MKRKLISAAIGQILIDRQLKDVEGEEMTPIEQAIEALEDACGNRCNAEYNPCQYREAIDALRAQPTGWQPIETAPKDGTFILLTGGTTSEDDYNKEGVETSRPVTAKWLNDPYCESDSGWVYDYWDGNWRSGYDKPTHWMPLPEVPSV